MTRVKTILHLIVPALGCAALLSLSTIVSRAQQTTGESVKPSAPPSGTITGRVVSSSGESLAGATVYLSTIGATNQPRSTMVDAGGNFRMDGLEAGSFYLWAGMPGLVPESPISPNEPRRYYHLGDSPTLTLTRGGVITGTVTTSTNSPVVSVSVRAFRIRDANGQPVQSVSSLSERLTDDRGVYRLYGLAPGAYVVSAGGPGRFLPSGASKFENDAPTYAPSSTRDTAVEIVVRGGEEITADIQYRGEPGHTISGTVTGFPPTPSVLPTNASITITEVRSRATLTSVNASAFSSYGFAFYGVADGEYELVAQRYSNSPGDTSASEARRVKVQGADLTGINLNLAPLASIAGRLVLESAPPADCVKRRITANQETVITARRSGPEIKPPARAAARTPTATAEVPLNLANQTADAVPDARGDFSLRNLRTGIYRIDPQLPQAGWYLRSISIGSTPATKNSEPNVARDGLSLKSGERLAGLTVTITEGAAALRGRVSVAEGQVLPSRLQVHLVPVERENAENVLRFFEARADSDGAFTVRNIAPGRYWIIARPDDESDPAKVKSIRQDSVLRAKVLRQAEDLKKEIFLKPCERSSDFDLPYPPSPPPGQ